MNLIKKKNTQKGDQSTEVRDCGVKGGNSSQASSYWYYKNYTLSNVIKHGKQGMFNGQLYTPELSADPGFGVTGGYCAI